MSKDFIPESVKKSLNYCSFLGKRAYDSINHCGDFWNTYNDYSIISFPSFTLPLFFLVVIISSDDMTNNLIKIINSFYNV